MPQKKGFFDKLSEFDAFYILQTADINTYDGLRLWIDTLVEQFSQHASTAENTDAAEKILLAMMAATATNEAWQVAYPKYKAVICDFDKRHKGERFTCVAELFTEGSRLHTLAEPETDQSPA